VCFFYYLDACAALSGSRQRFYVNMGFSDDDRILAVTSNICCDIATGTCLIYFGWLSNIWILCLFVLRRSPLCRVTYVINFAVLLCTIFMHMFYRVMKFIYQFAANLLSYIPTKYYWNGSTSDLVIAKSKRVNFFETV